MRFRPCLFVFFVIEVVSLSPAQSGYPFDHQILPSPVATIRTTVDEVNLAFTVTDKRGRFVSNLQSGDFELFDNHQEPQRLTYFQQRSDLPLHLAVVIDASSSVEYRLKYEQKAAVEFLKKTLRPGTDKAFVLAFNDEVIPLQDVTDRTEPISRALRKIKAHGDTALHDAIIVASHKLLRIPEGRLTRRAIILISDGEDTVNRSTLQQAELAAAHAEVIIFAVSTNYSRDDANSNGDVVLKNLAESTGGVLLPAREEGQLASAFHSIEKALRNQYVVAYNPAAFRADGSFRTVQVIPRKRGLRASCRKGYFAKDRGEP